MNIKQLKRQISALDDGRGDGGEGPAERSSIATGCPDMDQKLASGGLLAGALHEVAGSGYQDRSAALGFTLGLTARLLQERPGPLIWCQLRDVDRLHLHGPGLMAFGIDPGRLTKVTLKREIDLLWALEEALDCPFVAGVVGVLWAEKLYNFTASRRLSLRAKKSGVTALLLRSHRATGASATASRWRIAAQPSPPNGHQAQWRVDLCKSSNGAEHNWDVVWNHEAIRFDLAARLAHRAPAASDNKAPAASEDRKPAASEDKKPAASDTYKQRRVAR